MTVHVNRSDLVGALANADRIAPRGNTVEIASCVLLSASGGKITLRATDFTMWLSLNLTCEGDLEPVAVNAARLLEVVSNMRADHLTFSRTDTQLVIKGQERARRALTALTADTFPSPQPMPEALSIGMDVAAFRAGVEFVKPFICTDLARPNLCGLHLHSQAGAIRGVGAFRSGMAHADVGSTLTDFRMTVPPMFLEALLRAMPDTGPFFLVATDRVVEGSWAGGSLRSPLIDGEFPDYQRSIPSSEGRTLHVHADELMSAVSSARSFGQDDKAGGSTIVKLAMNGSVEVTAQSDKGEAIEPVDAEFKGEPLEIGLMSGQLAKGLASLKSCPMQIKFGDAVTPVLFVPERFPDRRAVLMPVRI